MERRNCLMSLFLYGMP